MAWALTFGDPEEAIGVIDAAREIDIPVAVSFSLDSDHQLNTGVKFADAVKTVDSQTDGYAEFFALNCSHPDEFIPAIDDQQWMQRVRCFRPNAAKMDKISLCKLGHLEEGDAVELGQQMGGIHERFPHIDIWGGCCGTCETHLEEIVSQLPTATQVA